MGAENQKFSRDDFFCRLRKQALYESKAKNLEDLGRSISFQYYRDFLLFLIGTSVILFIFIIPYNTDQTFGTSV